MNQERIAGTKAILTLIYILSFLSTEGFKLAISLLAEISLPMSLKVRFPSVLLQGLLNCVCVIQGTDFSFRFVLVNNWTFVGKSSKMQFSLNLILLWLLYKEFLVQVFYMVPAVLTPI